MNIIVDKSTWKKVKFGDVVENTNQTIKNPVESGIDKFIGLDHLESGDLKIKRFGNTSDGVTFTKLVSPGQTLFGKRRSYQRKVAFADFKAVCSGDILAFSAKPEFILDTYLPFVVSSDSFFAKAIATSAGSLSPRTRWSDLAKFEFLLPPIEVQSNIAELFWKIEDHKTKLKQMNATLDDQLAPMFIKDKVTYNLGDEILETTLLNVGHWSSGMTPKAASPEYYLNGIHPFVTIGDLSSEIIIETSSYLTEAGLNHAGGLLQKGSILISMYGTIGKVAIAGVPLATSQAIASVLVDEKICLSRYIFYFLQSLKNEFEHEGRGATQMNINRKIIIIMMISEI